MRYNSVIKFDPRNIQHRQDFYTYLQERSFKSIKNRYALEGNFGDVASMMTQQVCKYYASLEFEKPR